MLSHSSLNLKITDNMRFFFIPTILLSLLIVLGGAGSVAALDQAQGASIREKTARLQKLDGYVPLYWDSEKGILHMEISRFDTEILYQVSLPAGVGSNALGLDRGQLGGTHVVRFERSGPKVLMIEQNYRFRALTDDPAERSAVEDSFARSVLWGFTVEAAEGERVLVDATRFFLNDARGVAERLRAAKQGNYALDENRSALYLPRTRNFPQNTEVEAILTFANGGERGPLVGEVVPSPAALTVREHHSFVQLPDRNYSPRRVDPRVGVFGIELYDYASPITEPIEKHWIIRHRLQKRDPAAEVSEPIKPIVYYVDNSAPEPVRGALLEGASWWAEAFEAAGFRNAFQVRVLPPDADPMDIRYNVISWVHRSSRGWSYGDSVVDPRTGEIIKGNVTLGSLRVRQDFLIGSGLVPPDSGTGGSGAPGAGCSYGMLPDPDYLVALDPSANLTAMLLARLRQLAAHEVGHTLGLAHNFAASTYGRASVMDYPAPMVEIRNGRLDLSNAYGRGIGAYDKFAIRYAYSQVAAGSDEQSALERILREGTAAGMLFISDEDARPPGAAHPLANLWDNGDDPIAMLRHEMEVRRIGLAQFGLGNLPRGTPLSMLEARLLPLYLHHRYQLQAAVKSLGGVYYTYAVKTADGPDPARAQEIVSPARQREALAAVLDTLDADALAIPPRLLALLPPRAFGYERGTAELFAKRTDPIFDPLAAAGIAADLSISGLLEPHRAARLLQFHALNPSNPDFREALDALLARTWKATAARDPYHAAISRTIQSLVVTRLMDLSADADASSQVRAEASDALREIEAMAHGQAPDRETAAHYRATFDEIDRFLARPDSPRKHTVPLPSPPADPIGAAP